MGWPLPRALRAWKALSMGRVGIRRWPLCPRPVLACPPIFPKVASRLLVHPCHRVSLSTSLSYPNLNCCASAGYQILPRLALRRDKLVVRFLLRDRVVLPVVPAHAVPQMVCKVQLHSRRRCFCFFIDLYHAEKTLYSA